MRRSVVPNRLAALSIAILLALVALTISGVIATMASGTETRSLTSAADTQIVENAPTKNYGAATSLGVNENDQSNIGKDKFALVKWDLSGIAPRTQISSASVTLNVTNVSPQTYQAYALKEPWVESAATWNVYSGGMPWEVAGAKGPLDKEATVAGSITPSVKGKNTLTLPLAVVQGWVDNPTTNQGIIIANPSSTRGFNFDSREDPDPTRHPQLTLDLSPDTTPPETTIDSGPSGTISVADATFAFSSDETNSTFECSLDGAAYSTCTSPRSYAKLSNGSHTFDVRATDGAGNTDATPDKRNLSIDLSPIGPTNPYPGIRFFPVMGVYQGANGFLSESNLIENQYSTYVGTNENSYLDLNDGDGTRYWFCGGRKYRMRDFYVNESLAPSSRAQAQDPNWSNYKWNQNDVVDAMLDNSSAVRAEKAKACLFVAYSASSESDAVPQWMINDPDGLTWNGQGGVHVRMDKTEVLQGVTDFYIALIKHYGGDERIAQLSIGEYYPNADNPLTSTQTATFRSNMKTFWTDIIAAAPVDANGERLNILQSNPITTGGQVTLADIRSIDIGVTGSDPDMFAGGMTDANQSQLYGDVPLEHQTNAHRLIDGYPITWDGTSNPWGFRAGTMNAIRYEYLVWYHSSQGPIPFDSMLMRDNANLVSQWHEAWSQNGLNGSFAAQWGYLPNYPVVP